MLNIRKNLAHRAPPQTVVLGLRNLHTKYHAFSTICEIFSQFAPTIKVVELYYSYVPTTLSGESLSGESDEFFESDENFAQRIVSPDEKFRQSGCLAQKLSLCLMGHYWYSRE